MPEYPAGYERFLAFEFFRAAIGVFSIIGLRLHFDALAGDSLLLRFERGLGKRAVHRITRLCEVVLFNARGRSELPNRAAGMRAALAKKAIA